MNARGWCAGGALLAGFGGLAGPAAAAAKEPPVVAEQACRHPVVAVRAALPADARDACDGVGDALAFFATLGLALTEPLQIEIVARLPEAAGPTAAGCYLEAQKRILLLPYAEFRKARTWFRQPIDRALYRSLAAHEAAHALAACSFGIPHPTIQAKEYVAYVAMLSTMPAPLRARVLKAYPDAAFASTDRITALYYMFQPMAFGVAAWRHHARPGQGTDFLQAVLAGRALTD